MNIVYNIRMDRIERIPIGEQVHRALLRNIIVGHLQPGARIRDAALANELGVSRTPVREALLRLTREGFLSNDPGRGFSVCPLDLLEIQETYPILWNLEGLAISMSGDLSQSARKKLRKLNRQFGEIPYDLGVRLKLDAAWHATLISGCTNQRLRSMIEHLRNITRRYEMSYMSDQRFVDESIGDHEAIVSALERGDVDDARNLVKTHWERSLTVLTERMTEDKAES
jgi:DNA-binding GntR family transcriptional regulator